MDSSAHFAKQTDASTEKDNRKVSPIETKKPLVLTRLNLHELFLWVTETDFLVAS